MILVISTTKKKSNALKICNGLLKQRLVACCNLFPVESLYWWKGKIVDDHEILMILKAKDQDFEKIEQFIKTHHTYSVPEIVCINATKVNKPYLEWLDSETK